LEVDDLFSDGKTALLFSADSNKVIVMGVALVATVVRSGGGESKACGFWIERHHLPDSDRASGPPGVGTWTKKK